MDISKWEKYENKKKEIKKSCNGKFAVIWIVWTIVVAIGITAFVLLENLIGIAPTIIGILLFLGLSLVVALNKTGEYIRAIREQLLLLEQDEPFGKFRT